VAVTIVAPVTDTTTWRIVPFTTWFGVGEITASRAVEEGRVEPAGESGVTEAAGEPAGDGDADKPTGGDEDGPAAQPQSAIAARTESGRNPAREPCSILLLT